MPILSNIERRAMEAGRQEGMQEGMQTGLQQGMLQTARSDVLEVLTVRFNSVPLDLTNRVNQIADIAILKDLLKRAISIGSIAEFEQILDANSPAN